MSSSTGIQLDIRGVNMQKLRLHITYNNNLSFSEFNKICDSVNKAFNDINRESGLISVKQIKEHGAIITNIEKGSIFFDFVIPFIIDVSSGMLVNFISSRLFKRKNHKIDIHIINDEKGKTEIKIHIDN